jgi:hypothetical protein
VEFYDDEQDRVLVFLTNHLTLAAATVAAVYKQRWQIGVSSQGHINQSVRVRPRLRDSSLVAREASRSQSETMKPSDNMLRKEYAQLTRLQRAVNADVASLHANPVAETVDNVRKLQELAENESDTAALTGGVSAATWWEGGCVNWRSPRCPAKKTRRRGAGYNREREVPAQASGWRIGPQYRRWACSKTRPEGRARTGKCSADQGEAGVR